MVKTEMSFASRFVDEFRQDAGNARYGDLLGCLQREFVATMRRIGEELTPQELASAISGIVRAGAALELCGRANSAMALMIGASDQDARVTDGNGFSGTLKQLAERRMSEHPAFDRFADLSPVPAGREVPAESIPDGDEPVHGNFPSIH